MLEWMDQYRDSPRSETFLTIDKPMLIFLGLTLGDFVSGVVVFLVVIMSWDSGLSIPVALTGAILSAWTAREYRRVFPARFLQHWSWAAGFQKVPGVPRLFEKRRYLVFGP